MAMFNQCHKLLSGILLFCSHFSPIFLNLNQNYVPMISCSILFGQNICYMCQVKSRTHFVNTIDLNHSVLLYQSFLNPVRILATLGQKLDNYMKVKSKTKFAQTPQPQSISLNQNVLLDDRLIKFEYRSCWIKTYVKRPYTQQYRQCFSIKYFVLMISRSGSRMVYVGYVSRFNQTKTTLNMIQFSLILMRSRHDISLDISK